MLSLLYLAIPSSVLSPPLSLGVWSQQPVLSHPFYPLILCCVIFGFDVIWQYLSSFSWRLYQHHVGSTAVSGNSCSCTVVSSVVFVVPWRSKQLRKGLKSDLKWASLHVLSDQVWNFLRGCMWKNLKFTDVGTLCPFLHIAGATWYWSKELQFSTNIFSFTDIS